MSDHDSYSDGLAGGGTPAGRYGNKLAPTETLPVPMEQLMLGWRARRVNWSAWIRVICLLNNHDRLLGSFVVCASPGQV